MDYDEYMDAFFNENGQELIDYNQWSQQGIIDPKQQEAAQDIQDRLDEKNTSLFYEKYGLEPPEEK